MTCLEIKNRCDEGCHKEHLRYDRDIRRAARREFPVGTKVQFNAGVELIKGVVVGHADQPYHSADRVMVQNDATGKHWERKAWQLEKRNLL
jgi:hypothetical protein